MIKGETAMSSENSGHVLNTIKGHGLAVGDRFMFHGLASDPLPTMEGTRVELSKVGTKYMITTVTGEIYTWEFGPSAKVWADTSVTHHVTTEARTLDNGDTVYVGQCEHGWMTGFHVTEADARDVATGHGEVSRPLYVADIVAGTDKTLIPAAPVTEAETVAGKGIGDTINDATGHPFTITGFGDHGVQITSAHGIVDTISRSTALDWSEGNYAPVALADAVTLAVGDTVVTSAGDVGMVEARYSDGTVNVFGIVACRSVGVFYPVALTVITEDMTRAAQDVIKQNGRVFVAEADNFGGSAVFAVLVAHGWATLVNDGGMSRWTRTRYTADRKRITDGLAVWDYNLNAGRVVLSTVDGEGWFNVETINGGRSLMNGERVTTVHPFTRQTASDALAEDAAPLDIPAPGEAEVLQAEHDAAMSAWSAPLVSVLTGTPDASAPFAAKWGDGVASGKVWTAGGRLVEPLPCEAEVWAGTGTVVTYPLTRPNRTKLNKRKRKASKVNARRVRGGF